MDILNDVLDFMRAGFNEINAVQGLLIALVAAIVLPDLKRLPVIVLAATIIHLAVDILIPVIANGAALRLPPVLEASYWRYAAVVLVGYLVVILIFAIIKRLLFKR
ncbi:hypothetical protein ACFELO_08060 [Oceanicaulis sp. LC35]|uniref:hypothetical protein n=1 Tax=Oceanicaulis sp. LC35 TaxID=3349635 RepID=UPI003F83D45D